MQRTRKHHGKYWRKVWPAALLLALPLGLERSHAESLPPLARASWIWAQNSEAQCDLRHVFLLDSPPTNAMVLITADNGYELFVNGSLVGTEVGAASGIWQSVERYDITSRLAKGRNIIGIHGLDLGGVRGVIAAARVETKDHPPFELVTDQGWRAAREGRAVDYSHPEFIEGPEWHDARRVGPMGIAPWGREETVSEGRTRPKNGMGLYLFNADTGLELLYRDPEISSMYPIPLRPRPRPPALASGVNWDGPQEGRFLVADVTRGLNTVRPGDVKALRIVAVPAKTQPWMNQPVLGLTRDDPGKAVLGTVPVEPDGSAFFRAPSGVAVFFQALDGQGRAVQTMRSATHVQPGQTLSCTGCHDSRKDTPPPSGPLLAALREPSKITVGPEGSWTMRFDRLIQPVLDSQCVRCHHPQSGNIEAAKFDLTPDHAYASLTRSGQPSLNDLVLSAYREGVSSEGRNPAARSAVLVKLTDPAGHHGVRLDRVSLDRFTTWMDTYAQRAGAFSPEQERELERLRGAWADLLIEPAAQKTEARTRE